VDPTLLAVLTNVASAAFYDAVRDPLVSLVREAAPEESTWSSVVRDAVKAHAARTRHLDNDERTAVAAHLQSDEVRQLVRNVFYTRACGPTSSIRDSRQAFVALWHQRLELDRVNPFAVFDTLIDACDAALDATIKLSPSIAAHEAKSAARDASIESRLQAAEAQLRLLTGNTPVDASVAHAFAVSLGAAIVARYGKIVPPSLRGAAPVPIDDLYVVPSFRTTITYERLTSTGQRWVVLAAPGGGKTTFVHKLAVDLVNQSITLGGGVQPPFLPVELRAYAKRLAEKDVPIRQYLTALIQTDYALEVDPPTLDYLLLSGTLGVAFDGLDELPVIAQRRRVALNVESFARQYAQTPLVVTSRLVGYEHAALDEDIFMPAIIDVFSETQVEMYAQRFFRLDTRLTDDDALGRARAFAEESASVPDLRVNPLLLGLMCNLYKGPRSLPRNRPDVYDKCATMLFDEWDRSRGIDFGGPYESLLREVLRHLAFWIYAEPNLQLGVTEQAAIEQTQAFLAMWRFPDDERTAYRAAKGFVDFCRGRAWVFSDLGTDAQDQALFQFTHRTFLEFFAAEQLLDDNETTAQLADTLSPKVLAAEWEVVTQLAVHMRQQRKLGSADVLLRSFLDRARDQAEQSNVASFGARMLASVVPRPDTVCAVTTANLRSASALLYRQKRITEPLSLLVTLWNCDPENRSVVLGAWDQWMTEVLPAGDELALELLAHHHQLIDGLAGRLPRDAHEWWKAEMTTVAARHRSTVVALARTGHHQAAYDACTLGWYTWADAVINLGPELLWYPRLMGLMSETRGPIAFYLLGQRRRTLAGVTTALLSQPTPWFSNEAIRAVHAVSVDLDASRRRPSSLWLLLLAALAEPALDRPTHSATSAASIRLRDFAEQIAVRRDNASKPLPPVVEILLARGDEQAARAAEPRTRQIAGEAADVLLKWMIGEVSFVSPEETVAAHRGRSSGTHKRVAG
jgi:hypothetical protein